jgi:hypothetical protein
MTSREVLSTTVPTEAHARFANEHSPPFPSREGDRDGEGSGVYAGGVSYNRKATHHRNGSERLPRGRWVLRFQEGGDGEQERELPGVQASFSGEAARSRGRVSHGSHSHLFLLAARPGRSRRSRSRVSNWRHSQRAPLQTPHAPSGPAPPRCLPPRRCARGCSPRAGMD